MFNLYEDILRPRLFEKSRDDPEDAHILAKKALGVIQTSPLRSVVGILHLAWLNPRPVTIAGITFPNRVLLPAGFDKNAEVLPALQALGFGGIEVGSILPQYQKGNDRPRMFRFPEHEALLNRMGFNSDGVAAVVERLKLVKKKMRVPIIGSLGKMKETSLDEAGGDYMAVLMQVRPYVEAYTLNVSSPNTPGLRLLQGKAYLENLVRVCVALERSLATPESPEKPIFVKVSPDLTEQETEETVGAAVRGGAAGFIATNTTSDEEIKKMLGTTEMGGVSGAPLFDLSREMVKRIKKLAPKVPVLGSGGINVKDRAQQILDEGAEAVMILTGWVYHGNRLIQDIRSLG